MNIDKIEDREDFLYLYNYRFELLRNSFWNKDNMDIAYSMFDQNINILNDAHSKSLNYEKEISNLKEIKLISKFTEDVFDLSNLYNILKFQYEIYNLKRHNAIDITTLDNSNKIKGIEKIIFANLYNDDSVDVYTSNQLNYFKHDKLFSAFSNLRFKSYYSNHIEALKKEQSDMFETYVVIVMDNSFSMDDLITIFNGKHYMKDYRLMDFDIQSESNVFDLQGNRVK